MLLLPSAEEEQIRGWWVVSGDSGGWDLGDTTAGRFPSLVITPRTTIGLCRPIS